ncbi:MAG TPA: hypothetical protein VHT27_12040, partial [Solirubrobacteraceae bacterium]|nr:hypothetical protein [Solirubrobacteraceae bacterium]
MEDRFGRAAAAVVVALVLLTGVLAASAQAAGGPANLTLPTVAGKTVDEASLSSTSGKWSPSLGDTYIYQWERCDSSGAECSEIAGATSHKYKLQHVDVGHTMRALVTAADGEGTNSATSKATAVVAASKPRRLKGPVISGPAVDGKLLSAGSGSWGGTPPLSYTYQWKLCVLLQCSAIAGATESTYRATTSELGKQLRVVVTAHNTAGTATTTSPASKKIVAGPPVEVEAPSVEGLPIDGQTLKLNPGKWAGTQPYNLTYEWTRCNLLTEECSAIPGATGTTYQAGPLDVGNAFEVTVTASSGYGVASATSPRTSVVGALLPHNISLPGIGGLLRDTGLLSIVQGIWSGTEPITYSYQWELCNALGQACSEINGAVGTVLSLISPYVGSTVRVIETATNSAGSASAVSEPTSAISALLPSNTGLPSIGGLLTDGQSLTAALGSWTGSTPLSYAYQWLQCNSAGESCKEISGATGTTLGLISGLVGSTVKVVVTATNSGGSTQAVSEPTNIVKALLPGNNSLPSITGLLQDGQLLSTLTGSWSGTEPLSFAYQWQSCNSAGEACEDIKGATGAALSLVSGLVGDTVRVVVTATNPGGSTQAASEPTNVVGALLPSNTALPSIGGLLQDGQSLSAALGSWGGSGPISYSYQWLQCNGAGASCTEIAGATGATLGLISGLVGDTVKVVVTATNSGGSTKATSEPTSAIKALLPGNAGLPSISGLLQDGQGLTALAGSWTGTTPISYGYQWQLCNSAGEACKDISGAGEAALSLLSGFVGDTVRVLVTATNSGGSTQAASEPTSIIKALLPGNTSLPSVAGSLIDGQTLTAGNGSWTGTAPISYGYQWLQCNSKGEACTEVSGATGAT